MKIKRSDCEGLGYTRSQPYAECTRKGCNSGMITIPLKHYLTLKAYNRIIDIVKRYK